MYNQEQTLKSLTRTDRTKRALIDIAGTVFKTLFGTLDAKDGEYYDTAINKVNSNEKELLNLLKQQSHVVQTTIANFNATVSSLNDDRTILNKNLKKIEIALEESSHQGFNLELKQSIEEQLSLIEIMVNQLETEFSAIINAILFAKSNILHPFVMTPIQLIKELRTTIPHLRGTSFVLPLEDDFAYQLLEHISIHTYYKSKRIIFVISNPLVNLNVFPLYHLIPLPILKGHGNMIFILPTVEYLAISEDKSSYVILKSTDLCKPANKFLICPNPDPYFSSHIRPICETKILFHPTSIPKECDTRITSTPAEIWQKLKSSNSWIYVLPSQTDVTVTCSGSQSANFLLNGTGLISTKNNCKLYTSSTKLVSETTHFESPYKAIVPDFEIDIDNCCDQYQKKLNKTSIEFLSIPPVALNKESLNIASQKLNHIDNTIDQLSKESVFSKVVNNSYFSYIFLSIVKIILVYLGYRICRRCCKKRRNNKENDSESNKCCGMISNCLTFNINKRSNKVKDIAIELDDIRNESSTSEIESTKNESTPLRRSLRLSKLKDKI